MRALTLLLAISLVTGAAAAADRPVTSTLPPKASDGAAPCPAFLDREFRRLHSSQKVNLCTLAAGRPLLVVNTASHCGYTSQFRGLQALYEKYGGRGLVVVGFPSDSFDQEAANAAETAEVCYVNYGVKFTMVETTPVTGPGANPVFRELARQSREPAWNFNKYLVAADGKVVRHFGSGVAPDAAELTGAIEQLLR
jgi:glutathione peroxidase